jgi:hypothetical protein
MSGIKVQEKSTWGLNKAVERYGKPQHLYGAPPPKDESFPQFKVEQPSDKTFNDVPQSSWLRGGGGGGKPKR